MALSGFRNRCPDDDDAAGTHAAGSYQALDVLDVELLSQAVEGGVLEHRQLGRGPFRGELRRRRIGDLWVDSGRYSQTLQSRGSFPPDAVVIGCILKEREAGCINGYRLGKHDLVVFPEGAEMDYLLPAGTQWVALQSPRWLLGAAGIDPNALARVAVYSGTRPANAALADQLRLLTGAENENGRLPARGNCEPAEQTGALLQLVRRAVEREHERRGMRRPSLHTRAALVRQFERCLSDCDPCNTRICDLVSRLGVSQRTLENVFSTHVGMSPKRYLVITRLNEIQRALLRATPESTTVAEVARGNGIRQLGRFSAEYRKQFGELPSETLRRAR